MKKFKYSRLFLLTLIVFIMGNTITGCENVRRNISGISLFSMEENAEVPDKDLDASSYDNSRLESSETNIEDSREAESAFVLDEAAEVSTKYMGAEIADPDINPPVIEAQDKTVPYGTYLHLNDIASVADDFDDSPVLEILSVREKNVESTDSTAISSEKEYLHVDTADTAASEIAAAADTQDNNSKQETSEMNSSAADNMTAFTTATTGEDSETALVSNPDQSQSESKASDTANARFNEQSDIGAAGSTSAVESEFAEANDFNDGYLFSNPGSFILDLAGTDRSGNRSQKSITITVIDSVVPVLSGLREKYTLTDKEADSPDYLEGITAIDEIDGNLSASIIVDESKVKYGTAGTYSIEYSVSDLSGNTAIATVPIVIEDTTPPEITLSQSTINLFVTDGKPDYSSFVTATDATDGDVKSSLTVDDASVKYSYPGTYSTILCVQDKSGNKAEKAITINVTAGWKTIGEKTFYYSPKDGSLFHNWGIVDGKKYYFDPEDGHVRHGWRTIDGQKYYLDPNDGHLLTGLQTINNKQYLLDSKDGHLLTGWQTIGAKRYYFDPEDGHMRHSWVTINGLKYYFDPNDGFMYTGTHNIDGDQYDFGTNGIAEKVVVQQRSSVTSDNSTNNNTEIAYIGNRNSRIFHHSWCASVRKMKDHNKVGFGSRDDAVNSGYRPCKNCNP